MATFVLVPGAWLGGWVRKKVVPMLEDEGRVAQPVTLTGTGERVHLASKEVGIETAMRDGLNLIERNDLDDVVRPGHGFAGKIVAAVADRVPRKVRTLLYLDAFRPEKARTPQGAFEPAEFGPLSPDSWSIPFTEKVLDSIGKDVQGPDPAWMLAKGAPWPGGTGASP